MSAFGDTIITSLVVIGMIWIAVLSASFREAFAIFAGLAAVAVVLSVLALNPWSLNPWSVKLSTVPAASHNEQSVRPQPAAPAASIVGEQSIPPNLDRGAPVDVEADVSATWAVAHFDAELRRQCEPCREAAGDASAPVTVLKYDASAEFLHAIADGVSGSIHAVDRLGRQFTVYWFSELDPGGGSWSAHCGLPALERGLRITGFKTQSDAEAWVIKASNRMRELGVNVDG